MTLGVVGDQDLSRLVSGENKSVKHRKAEMLIEDGYPIKILKESDFLGPVAHSSPTLAR